MPRSYAPLLCRPLHPQDGGIGSLLSLAVGEGSVAKAVVHRMDAGLMKAGTL